jgi:hypothetical protein
VDSRRLWAGFTRAGIPEEVGVASGGSPESVREEHAASGSSIAEPVFRDSQPVWFGREPCPVCGFPIGAVRGSKQAICQNCGFKDGCC